MRKLFCYKTPAPAFYGVKLKKIVSSGSTTTEYAGNYVYENSSLKFFNHAEGYVDVNGSTYKYVYQYKDHLGNIRLSYSDSDGNGSIDASTEIIEEKNYYPFGLEHKGYNNNPTSSSTALKWKYNGTEYEESLGLDLYEMPLRQYDPAIGRWTSIDPVTHYSMSTYTAFDNNPVFFADPSGANSIYNWKTGQYVINGQQVSQSEAIAYAQNGGNADGSNNNNSNEISLPNPVNIEFAKSSGCQQGNCYDPVDFKNDSPETIYKKLVNNFATLINDKNKSIRSGNAMINVYIEELIRLDNIYGETDKESGNIINKTIKYKGGTIEIVVLPVTNDPIVGYRFKGAVRRMQGSNFYYSYEAQLTGKYRNKVKGWDNSGFKPKMINLRFSNIDQYNSFVKEIKKNIE